MKRAWYKYRKSRCINSCEFHEWVSGIYRIMLFDPKDIQQLNTNIYELKPDKWGNRNAKFEISGSETP